MKDNYSSTRVSMRKRILVLVTIIHFGFLLSSQQIVIQPYLQDATPSSMTVMWEADNVGEAHVFWGLSPFELSDSLVSSSQSGNANSRIHTTIITDLLANQKYYYKVKMQDETTSLVYHFRTPANSQSENSTQLIAISDMQRDGSHPDKFAEIVNDGIIPVLDSLINDDLSHLEAILIPGDLVVTGGTYSQWQDHFFNPSDSLTPYVPLYPVLGNHEYFGGGNSNFLKYFTMPSNGPAGLQDQVWYKDISNIRIVGLNSNSNGTEKAAQITWLETVLTDACSNTDIDFVFAELHHPYKSELWTPGESDFTGDVIAKLETFTDSCSKPSVHFFGHTHGYSRGQSADHEHLWVNVATAGGAIDNWGEFPNADYAEFSKSQDEYGFVVVEVEACDEPSMTLKRFGRGDQDVIQDNVLRDEITLRKFEFPPNTPSNIYPAGDSIDATCLKLKASQFYGVGDLHQASQWQIALGGDFQDSLVAEEWFQYENFYNEVNTQANDDLTDVNIDNLVSNKTYHWRVRYRDQYLKWSDWSSSSTFFLANAGAVISSNLIVNQGAEDGITGWTGDIESIENAGCNSVLPFQGDFNFAIGGVCANESSVGLAEQLIDLSAYEADIDNDLLSVQLSGYMRDYSGSDVPEMYCEFYDNSNPLSTSLTISNATSTWTNKTLTIPIPIGSSTCKVILKGTRNAGSDNDSYFDELSLVVTERVNCPACIGSSNVDLDEDGFCDDLDCNDNDENVYPGALEVCDQIDTNCDGRSDSGAIVTWTGNGTSSDWADGKNWNQNFVPLACQHVLIPSGFTLQLSDTYACKSIEIQTGSELLVNTNSLLLVNNEVNPLVPSIDVFGKLTVEGKVQVRASSLDEVIIRTGGEIENIGKVEIE